MGKSIFTIIMFIILNNAVAQENDKEKNTLLTIGFNQVKESANFGLVFKGLGLYYGRSWIRLNEKRLFSYENEIGIGLLFSHKIPALGFYLKPADLGYLFKFTNNENAVYIGPSLLLEYSYNLYPDLQAGFDYWFSDFSFGLKGQYDIKYFGSVFQFRLNSSLLGFVSRQSAYRDPYFYDIGFNHAVKHLHQDISFVSINDFNTARLEILWKHNHSSRITFAYVLKYMGYYKAPDISILNHNFRLIIGKKGN